MAWSGWKTQFGVLRHPGGQDVERELQRQADLDSVLCAATDTCDIGIVDRLPHISLPLYMK